MGKKAKPRKPRSKLRRLSVRMGFALLVIVTALGLAGGWYVHHPRTWLDRADKTWPTWVVKSLMAVGNPVADVTDSLGWTGHDAVYEYDEAAPAGSITFAGLPVRIGKPAPDDVVVLNRGEFVVGWSPSLRHPLWCAYHVVRNAKFHDGQRPSFLLDHSAPHSPRPEEYTKSNYDRGHMVPNHAIVTRYGNEARRKTFYMSNIVPQRAALNRDVWRNLEHRIANLWPARYGEIWVIVGAIPSECGQKIGRGIDVPASFYQVVIAQEKMDVRAFAVLIPNECPWGTYAARHLITIDELEARTGLDFNPDMPAFIQDPLEAELPTRLWPVLPSDILRIFF